MLSDVAACVPADPGPLCRWFLQGPRLELQTLRPRVFGSDRESIIAAGEALLTARVLLRSQGALGIAALLPDPGRPELVAIIQVDGFASASADDRALARALTGPVVTTDISTTDDPAALLARLRAAARQEQAWLATMPPVPRPGIDHARATPRPPGGDLVVGTTLDVPGAQLRAGQATQRVTLTAASAGVHVSRPQGRSIPEGDRATLRARLGGGLWPQVALHCAWEAH